HLTLDSGRHGLFRWTFSPGTGRISLSFDLNLKPITDFGLRIIDPTCFFSFRDRLYLGVSCSNRDWFYGQTFVSFLLEVDGQEIDRPLEFGTLTNILREPLSDLGECTASAPPSVHFYRAAELFLRNGIRGQNFEVESRAGKEEPGHVLYGPYVNLSSGIYQVRL